MTPDWSALRGSIEDATAAYVDPRAIEATFEALGSVGVQQLSTDNVQAVLHVARDGVLELNPTGTRFSEGKISARFGDLVEDADWIPRADGFATGAYKRADETFAWAKPLIGDRPFRIAAHSLGAWTSCAATMFVRPSQIISIDAWESPKPATPAWWAAHPELADLLTMVCHGQDPWWHWPFRILGDHGMRHTPDDECKTILWLRNGGYEWAAENGVNSGDMLDASDHGPDTVIAAVDKLERAYT